jgi:hypothetical protein
MRSRLCKGHLVETCGPSGSQVSAFCGEQPQKVFLLPLVVLTFYVAIRLAPAFRVAPGFIGGIGAVLLVIASIHNAAMDWLVPGVALSVSLWRRS